MDEKRKKKGGLKEGTYCWVKDAAIAGTDLFTKGMILSINGNKVTVETSNGVIHVVDRVIIPAG